MSVSTNLPVEALLEELSKSKNEEIVDFYKWLKDTCDESIYSSPTITCVNWDHPELVAFDYYTTDALEEDGIDADDCIRYREECDGSLVQLNDGCLCDDARDLIDDAFQEFEDEEDDSE